MKNYEKPIILRSDELAEGIYLASGVGPGGGSTGGTDCYTVSGEIKQTPQQGRENYCIQFDAVHAADHHSTGQVLVVSFNQPVTYVSSKGTLSGGDGTSTLRIDYSYHSNFEENVGLGDVYVSAGDGLALTGALLECNCDNDH